MSSEPLYPPPAPPPKRHGGKTDMKVITVIQPWASLISLNEKKIETRSWKTNYRGPLAIHASKNMPKWARDLCESEPFRSTFKNTGITYGLLNPDMVQCLPLGKIIATCNLADCFDSKFIRYSYFL